MKFDLLYELPVPYPWTDGLRAREKARYQNAIEQVKLADKVGFSTAWFVEHHFRESRSHCSVPEVMIAALASVTERIRLGFGVQLLPHGFSNPVKVAERVAACDLVSNGRVEWGTGRSTPQEQRPFGVPPGEESKKQWLDALQAVVKMWEDEPFTWKSEYFDFPNARHVLPKPVQDPHPPAWLATSSEGSPARAGHAGLGLLSFTILSPLTVIARQVREYKAAIQEAEPATKVINNNVGTLTLVHCAETTQQAEENGAWDSVWWWYQSLADLIINYDLAHLSEEERAIQRQTLFPLLTQHEAGTLNNADLQEHDMLIVGDVEECIVKAKRYADAGADHLLCYIDFGNISHEAAMTSIELLGTKVIPELENYQPNYDRFAETDEEEFHPQGAYIKAKADGFSISPGGLGDPIPTATNS
jgi:alkanesulfonate monooxygenase SsuD/methylene tetrahydromethanopterin reductase-like flavin-dependent oxidoreductase (luciferase family)